MIYSRYFKRPLDIGLALIMAVMLSWMILLLAGVYVITLNFPVFFKPLRVGKQNTVFNMIKFRTLTTDDTKPGLERRFAFGSVLRALSLDELPQLWNVLKGDMSLIGPRPLPPNYLPLYSEKQKLRHTVRPGITGWAQVNGRNSIGWQEKMDLDNYYVTHLSFALDLLIFFKTIVLLLSFRKDVSLNEKPFEGNAANE